MDDTSMAVTAAKLPFNLKKHDWIWQRCRRATVTAKSLGAIQPLDYIAIAVF